MVTEDIRLQGLIFGKGIPVRKSGQSACRLRNGGGGGQAAVG